MLKLIPLCCLVGWWAKQADMTINHWVPERGITVHHWQAVVIGHSGNQDKHGKQKNFSHHQPGSYLHLKYVDNDVAMAM